MTNLIRQNPALSAMLVSAVILLTASAVLPPSPVWITDNGNKYMIMRNFAETGKLELHPAVPGTFPTGGFHFKRTAEGYRSFYPEILPVLAGYPYRISGKHAAVLIPLVCGILLAGAVAAKFRSFTAGILTMTATPCMFYSLLLWEMIPAVLAGFCGVMLLREKRFFSGGLVLALGLFMREELYFLGGVSGLVLLFQKEWRALLRLSCGFLCGVLPVWLTQYLLTGHILGVHGSTYYLNNRTGFDLKDEISGVFWNYFQHLFRFEMCGALIVPVLFLLLAALPKADKKTQNFKLILLAGCSVLFFIGEVKFHGSPSLCYAAALSAGFISTLPLCWLFWGNWKIFLFSGPWKNRFTAWIVILFTLLVPPLLTRHDVGLFWGARHFLFVMPFAVYFSLKALKHMPHKKLLLHGLAGLSVLWQLCGLAALLRVSEESDAFTGTILATAPQTVASDVFFLPEQTPELFFKRDFCEVTTPEQLDALIAGMKKKNQKEFLFITSQRWSKLAPETRKKLAQTTTPGYSYKYEQNVSGFMDLIVIQLYLKDIK